MITLIYGENVQAARARFKSLIKSFRDKNYEVVTIDPKQAIDPQLTANSLFTNNILFVLENPKKIDKFFNKEAELIILYDQAASATLTRNLPKGATIEKFDLPKKLFFFLESFYPTNQEKCLFLLYELLEIEPIELVSFMLARQIRDLYWVTADEKSMGLPSWRLGKLKSQATKFTKEKLEKVISRFSELDFQSKVGITDLATSLDLVIAKELE